VGQKLTSFEIEQVGLPGGHFSKYLFNGERLIVTEYSKRKESVKLAPEEIYLLDSVFSSVRIDTLRDSYSRPVMDGVNRTFTFEYSGKIKEIRLWNYYLENLDRFLIEVNNLLKKKHQIISFGENMLSRPDTVFYIHPDFFLTVEKPDSNYYDPSIQCFKKGRLITEVLDSVIYCQCVIYALFNKRNEFPRLDPWRANKIDGFTWELLFYDSNKVLLNTENRTATTPISYIDERVVITQGTRPSVFIYRYYKTVLIK